MGVTWASCFYVSKVENKFPGKYMFVDCVADHGDVGKEGRDVIEPSNDMQ